MANLIQTLGGKIRQGYEWLKSKARSVVEKIQSWHERYKQQRERKIQHGNYVNEILDSDLAYLPEQTDIQLRQRLTSRLESLENGHLFEHFKSLSFEKRKEYIENVLLPMVCNEMNVSPSFAGWYQDNSTIGVYCEDVRGIALNEMFIATDNDYVLRNIINTVIHECKHAMQWDAVSGRNTHGYSPQLIEAWRRNFADYIQPEESDEGYAKQPVEYDAASFAESVYPTD